MFETQIEESAAALEVLRSEIAELKAVDAAAVTDEQKTRMDAIIPEWDAAEAAHNALVERSDKLNKIESTTIREAVGAPAVHVKRDAFEGVENVRFAVDQVGNVRMGSDEIIERAQRAFEGGARGLKTADLETLMERIETVPGAAEHALVHGTPAYRAAFSSFLRSQGQNVVYTSDEAAAVRTALSLTGANGGYTLPTILDPTLIKTGTASKNPIRQLATVVSGTQNVWHGVTVGAVTSYWTAEAAALTDGNPVFTQPPITASKMTGYLPGSFEIWEDSALQASLPGLIVESFEYLESDAFVSGSGSGAPTGVITALTTSSRVAPVTGGVFTTASAADVFALLNAIPSRFEDSSTWLGNKTTFNTIKQMSTGSQGSYFWTDFNNAVGEGQGLLGSPIAKASAVTATVTTGSVLLVLGDFSRYVIYDRIGTSVEFDPIVVNTSGLPTGQRALIAHKRVGGDVVDTNAFRMLKL